MASSIGARVPRRHSLLYRVAWLRRNRCSLLLAWLCVLILANPLFSTTRLGAKSLAIGLMVVLLLAIWALRVRLAWLLAALALAAGAAVAIILSPGEQHWLRPISVAAVVVLIGAVTVALLRYVLDWHLITIDKVFGAVAAYMLIAFTFVPTFLALLLGQISPLLLLGAVLFLVAQRQGRLLLAGAAADLMLLKPHLTYLFWVAFLLWSLRSSTIPIAPVASPCCITKTAPRRTSWPPKVSRRVPRWKVERRSSPISGIACRWRTFLPGRQCTISRCNPDRGASCAAVPEPRRS